MKISFQNRQYCPPKADAKVGSTGHNAIRRLRLENDRHDRFGPLDAGPEMVGVPAGNFIRGAADSGSGNSSTREGITPLGDNNGL